MRDQVYLLRAIQNVPQNGKPQRGQMHADLMRASCFRMRFEQRLNLPPFKHLEMCFRWLSLFTDHNGAMSAADVGLQHVPGGVLIPGWDAFYDSLIHLLDLVLLELTVEFAVCFRCAREDYHAAGDLVQAMNNKNLPVLVFQHLTQVWRVRFPAVGQHRQVRRFVDDKNVFIGV